MSAGTALAVPTSGRTCQHILTLSSWSQSDPSAETCSHNPPIRQRSTIRLAVAPGHRLSPFVRILRCAEYLSGTREQSPLLPWRLAVERNTAVHRAADNEANRVSTDLNNHCS